MGRAKKICQGDAVEVRWWDTMGMETGWLEGQELVEALVGSGEMRSLGFVLQVDKEAVYLATRRDKVHDFYSGVTKIPFGCVRSIKKL